MQQVILSASKPDRLRKDSTSGKALTLTKSTLRSAHTPHCVRCWHWWQRETLSCISWTSTQVFLDGHLEEEVWVQQPPGFPMAAVSHSCRVHRALYGLKQAPLAWHERLSDELAVLGYTPSQAEPGLFIQHNKQGST